MSILQQLRTLGANRPLSHNEARSITERQAARLRKLLDVEDDYIFPATTIDDLPHITVTLDHAPSTDGRAMQESGITGWSPEDRSWHIFINPDHHVHRQRFSLLHEYKHVIDYPVYQTAYPATARASHEERREAICDYFAACVLMPRVLVRRAWTGFSQDPKELAGLFGVSPAAMRYRLTDLGLLERQRCQTTFFRTTPTEPQGDLISASVATAGAAP